jgi:hypothetical protein
MRPLNLKNIFKALFLIRQWQNLTAHNTRYISFNLEARSSALSFDKETAGMRFIYFLLIKSFWVSSPLLWDMLII